MDQGSTLEDALDVIPDFEKAGVDIMDISGGFCGYTGNGAEEEGYFSELTAPIMNITTCPVKRLSLGKISPCAMYVK